MKNETKATHTPGPWHRQNYTIKRDDGRVLAKCNIEHNDEQEANAKLIAAAPDLLEALEDLQDSIVKAINGGNELYDASPETALGDWLTIVNSAIRKATGEQN